MRIACDGIKRDEWNNFDSKGLWLKAKKCIEEEEEGKEKQTKPCGGGMRKEPTKENYMVNFQPCYNGMVWQLCVCNANKV